ncbi:MAG TPA: transposase [Streptosporangiaceae bacterium]|nr:transposase [Streptosporangiaceae bacterium]
MLPATTLPAAVPACEDAAVCGTSWRRHRKTPPRDGDAALAELQAMGSLWRGAGGVIEEGPVPPEGIVVIGARPGAYAPALDAAAAPRAAGQVTGGAGLGILPAILSASVIGDALARAGVPARAVRNTSPVLAAETILTAPLHRGAMNMTAVWDARIGRARETDAGYDLPGKSSVSDACHYVGAKAIAHVLAAVIGPPRPACQAPAPGPAGGDGKPPASSCCPACRSPLPAAAAAGNASRALSGPVTTEPGGGWCCGLWHGLRAVAEDGTHFDLLRGPGKETSENSVHFGSPAGSGPNAHMVSLTGIWTRTEIAVALGGNSVSGKHLADQLLPALGPGMAVLGDRGFPSHEGLLAIRGTGAHFVMRASASWGLRRCGRPLADGTYLTKISYRGRTMKARVIEFHIDLTTRLPAGGPLLTAAAADGAVITILTDGDGDGAAACQSDAPGVRVQVSQTFTLITSLRDTVAFPAAGIAALYGDRWSIELVFSELKVTVMAAGSTCRSPKPAGAYSELLAAITLQTSLRLPGAHYAPQIGVPPGRISFTALRDTAADSINLGHGGTASLLSGALHRLHAAITRHPARWTVPHRPGRHYPSYTIKKVRSRKHGDIVASTTSTHMLPCAPAPGAPADDAGVHPGHPCPATAAKPPPPG